MISAAVHIGAAATTPTGAAGGVEQFDNVIMLRAAAATPIHRSTYCIRSSQCSQSAGRPRALVIAGTVSHCVQSSKSRLLPAPYIMLNDPPAADIATQGAGACELANGFIG